MLPEDDPSDLNQIHLYEHEIKSLQKLLAKFMFSTSSASDVARFGVLRQEVASQLGMELELWEKQIINIVGSLQSKPIKDISVGIFTRLAGEDNGRVSQPQ